MKLSKPHRLAGEAVVESPGPETQRGVTGIGRYRW